MAQSLKACLAFLILMAFVGSNQATTPANISVAEAAAAASNARYWMQMQNAARTFGCSEDKCVEACEQDWERNGEHCYLWNTGAKNWTDAEDFCQKAGGHLASAVHTNATNNFILEETKRRGLNRLWLGGNDLEEDGAWKWTDCTPWEDTFWSTATGEPNNWGGPEDCLEIFHNWKWNDFPCSREQGFVCSKKICSGAEATTPRDEVTPTPLSKEATGKGATGEGATGDSVMWKKSTSISLVVTLLLLF